MNENPGFWSKGRNRAVVYGLGFVLVLGSYMVGSPELRTASRDSSKKTRLEANTSSKTEIQDVEPIANVKTQEPQTQQTITPTTSVIKPNKNLVVGRTYAGLSDDHTGSDNKNFDRYADATSPYQTVDSKKELPTRNQSNKQQVSEAASYEDGKTEEPKNIKKDIPVKPNAFGAGFFNVSSSNSLNRLEKNTDSVEQPANPIDPETKMKKTNPVVYYAAGGYSSEEICNQLTSSDPENKVFVFFDAYDQGQKKSQKNLFAFHIQSETKLGDFFDHSKSGETYVSSQNKILFNYQQQASNRLFTQFFGIPKSPTNQTYWKMYMLCKSDNCKGADGVATQAGGWVQVGFLDQQPVKNGDVFAFLFDRKPFSKIDCMN